MGVDTRHLQITVTEQFLKGQESASVHQEVTCEGVTEGVPGTRGGRNLRGGIKRRKLGTATLAGVPGGPLLISFDRTDYAFGCLWTERLPRP